MSDDELVRAMADAIFRSFNPWISNSLANEPVGVRVMYDAHARAALAEAEPVIRERCAVPADKEILVAEHLAENAAYNGSYQGSVFANEHKAIAKRIAAAIRTGGTTT